MCYRTIYHNIYTDGEKDITERIDCCSPGYMCAHPKVRELQRQMGRPKRPVSSGLGITYNGNSVFPPTPRSMSPPGSRGSDSEKRRKRSPGLSYADDKAATADRERERDRRRHREWSATAEPRHKPYAPEPPSPRAASRAIPIKRASTMPYGMETPPERGRRPIIVEERAPRQVPAAVPVDIQEHSSSRQRRSGRRDSTFLTPDFRRTSSPQGYGSAESDHERRERRRRRRDARHQAAAMATSMPAFGNTDIYASSYGSSYGSSNGSAVPSPVVGSSPAVAAVKKELRWEDQMRARQNAKIDRRPKLSRSATVNNTVQGEVKSILKNGPSVTQEPRRASATIADDDLADLYRSVESMSFHDRETSAERRARVAEESDSAAYLDRLRQRFSMPPRRFTAGSGSKRRTEIWYPDEGRYKYSSYE